MFILKNVFRNLKNRGAYTPLMTFFTALLVILLLVFSHSYMQNKAEYARVCEVIPVFGKITNSSNTLEDGLQIDAEKMDSLEEKGFMSKVQKTAYFYAYLGKDEEIYPEIKMTAVDALETITVIDPQYVQFLEGFDAQCLSGNAAEGIFSSYFLEEKNLKLGDTYSAEVYSPTYDDFGGMTFVFEKVRKLEIHVVGMYDDSRMGLSAFSNFSQVILPMGLYTEVCKAQEMPSYYDAYNFQLKNPSDLNAFKAEAEELGFQGFQGSSGDSSKEFRLGNTLVMQDRVFIETANHILRNDKLYMFLYPALYAVVFLLSLSVSFLSMQYRKRELGMLYAMGHTKLQAAGIYFGEKLCIAFLGAGAALLLFMLITGSVHIQFLLFASLFVVCDVIGTLVSLILIGRKSVLEIMREE